MKNNMYIYVIGGLLVLGVVGFMLMQPKDTQPVVADVAQDEPQVTEQMVPQEMGTIVDVAVANGNFNTLVAAVKAAGLAETLSGPGPFTVFAPTDEAFAKLPPGTVEGLLEDPEALANILKYHVVSGKVMAADVVGLTAAATVQGQELTVTVEGEKVMINNATVVITDVEASNGVIHVIDTVLLPE